MKRDVARLTSRTFDVLVVGGGIYGLAIAYDAALRGLGVALVERDDFGSGNSFNHLRTIHGGLRYLQTLDLARARESVRERRTLAAIAPTAVRPLPFVLPLSRSMTRGRLAMQAGFALDRLVAFDRDRGLPPSHQLPTGRVISRAEAMDRFPQLRRRGMTGAAVWYDYVTTEADRLTYAFGEAASQNGAVLANHTEAIALATAGPRVIGVRAKDIETGRELDISARVTVNATGGAVGGLLKAAGIPWSVPLLKAMNLVTRRPAAEAALGGRSASGGHLFLVPWRGRALFGTWESSRRHDPGDAGVLEAEVAPFIVALNEAFPSLDLTRADVTLVHRGLVPAVVGTDGSVSLEGHGRVRDHAGDGVEGLVTVAGAKYTTARAVAERVTDGLLEKLQRSPVACRTAVTALPVRNGDLVHAIRHEMVVTLRDAVIRRTPLGALGYPGDDEVDRAATIAAAELGWSPDRTRTEIEDVRRFYDVGQQ
jgi:glycerol-3-phosphate dehydrogenase